MQNIRNFSIIAHIDHGKSTIADRFIQHCGGLSDREMSSQVLDSMDIEKERGITIKSHPIQMIYKHTNNENYKLNLIDTPGHVDFTYEVSRSLAACEGALLLIDATQGVEAQTVSNAYLAIEAELSIIPIINKIDAKNADKENVISQVVDLLGFKEEEILLISAKEGKGIDKVFNDYKTYSNKSKGLVNNTKKNFSLKAMHEKFGKIMDKYIKLPEFVSLKLPEIKKL